jgi:hypothetical protein
MKNVCVFFFGLLVLGACSNETNLKLIINNNDTSSSSQFVDISINNEIVFSEYIPYKNITSNFIEKDLNILNGKHVIIVRRNGNEGEKLVINLNRDTAILIRLDKDSVMFLPTNSRASN